MASKNGVCQSMRRRVMREEEYTCAECRIVGWEHRHKGPSSANAYFSFPTQDVNVYLSIDHIHARSRGGSSDRENLRVLCTTCNTKKGVKLVWWSADVAAMEEHW